MLTKVLAACDEDGHFHIIKYNDREKVVKFLKNKIDCGDMWANSVENPTEDEAIKMGDEDFYEFLYDGFVQRE